MRSETCRLSDHGCNWVLDFCFFLLLCTSKCVTGSIDGSNLNMVGSEYDTVLSGSLKGEIWKLSRSIIHGFNCVLIFFSLKVHFEMC